MQSDFEELIDEFVLEARERADIVESELLRIGSGQDADRQLIDEAVARIKRELHTLKGNSGMMGLRELQALAHRMEDEIELLDLDQPVVDQLLGDLDRLRILVATLGPEDETAAEDTEDSVLEERASDATAVRVPFTKIDQLIETQAETLIHRNRLNDVLETGSALDEEDLEDYVSASKLAWQESRRASEDLDKVLARLREQVTELGMVPLQSLFRSLGRIVHDESATAGKKVELLIEGGETPLDKTLLHTAGDGLGHLVRNAVIHGIETPSDRIVKGKPETGRIRVSAELQASEVAISVSDDGSGIDIAGLEKRAREQGISSSNDLFLLFQEGISTRQTTDLGAGRGVGLAAVKRAVDRSGGRIDVKSSPTLGSTFTLRLPVTASILRALAVRIDSEEYAISLAAVTETIRLREQDLHELNHTGVVRWRGQLVPLLDLGEAFGTATDEALRNLVIIIDVAGHLRGLAVDSIEGIRDIVVRGLDPIVGEPKGISGSTILGDGRVILILDHHALSTLPSTAEN